MKTLYNAGARKLAIGESVELHGWVVSRPRVLKQRVFIDLIDGTGKLPLVIHRQGQEELYLQACKLQAEAAIKVLGVVCACPNGTDEATTEIDVRALQVVGDVNSPLRPRTDTDIFAPQNADHLLRNRHLFIRNPKVMAILKFRHLLMGAVHSWFREQGYVEITAPILTPIPLYDDGTAINLDLHGQNVFLTQCVGYYLEASAHAFERVYNIGPSFRGEESRSKRHLMEYWHIKAEATWMSLEEGMNAVEHLVTYLTQTCRDGQDEVTSWLGTEFNEDALHGPFPRVTYKEVVEILARAGFAFPFGKSLGNDEEVFLSQHFQSPLWVVGVPRSVEPFPYVIDPNDSTLTRTADLIASRGFGELLGVAEKSTTVSELQERMIEKGKWGRSEYDWLVDVRRMGCVPHIGYGIGVERFLRWMLQFEHVRDGIPFPRTFKRQVYP